MKELCYYMKKFYIVESDENGIHDNHIDTNIRKNMSVHISKYFTEKTLYGVENIVYNVIYNAKIGIIDNNHIIFPEMLVISNKYDLNDLYYFTIYIGDEIIWKISMKYIMSLYKPQLIDSKYYINMLTSFFVKYFIDPVTNIKFEGIYKYALRNNKIQFKLDCMNQIYYELNCEGIYYNEYNKNFYEDYCKRGLDVHTTLEYIKPKRIINNGLDADICVI